MTIRKVHAKAVGIPLERPTQMSTRILHERHFVIVEVEDDDGTGVGYSYAGTNGSTLLAAAVEDLLSPVLLGCAAEEITELWQRMYQECLLVGRRGALLRAMSAVDIALWDLMGKRSNLPLSVLLGGSTIRPLAAYASGGYYHADDRSDSDAVRLEITGDRNLGFRDHKIKVGGRSIADDASRVAAAVEAMDGEGRLALDANNAYGTVAEAVRAARAFESAAGEMGIWWFEEPLSPEDVAGSAEIARVLETPVATGEIHQTRWDFASLIRERAADILQPDVGVVGGVTEFMRIAHTALSFDRPIAPHWHANVHAHLVAALPNQPVIEYFDLGKDLYNFEKLITEESRLLVENGHVQLSDRPGIGITFDDDLVRKYQIGP